MTREECEVLLLDMLRDIWSTYKLYNPDGMYLTLCAIEDEKGLFLTANNDCYEEDSGKPLDVHKTEGEDDDSI